MKEDGVVRRWPGLPAGIDISPFKTANPRMGFAFTGRKRAH
jgi:hypothetical protein